eukprot:TRINITY_DN2781_c0_g2_i3.p1 TRINITY_DN2781_c0_g2~~TRINITY_DN2781_c0_g2_i3.p1  ORF type:complete len:268 (+),score=82.29 TRINITY_DN2781_c0_g2_i3:308-1111(+)
MENCMSSLVKYLLFFTNFLIFILGFTVFGLGIWVLVDKPSFLTLFQEAQSVSGTTDSFNVEIYTSAAYILLVVSFLVVLISFFGCCGAIKENKCMLGTYFILIVALFIMMVVGAVHGYNGDLESTIKEPLKEVLHKYKDDVTDPTNPLFAYKAAWNEVQKELKCCGVDNVKDWAGNDFNWTPSSANKPAGCCMVNQEGAELTEEEQLECRSFAQDSENETYYFQGCYTMIKERIDSNQNTVLGVAIGVVVVMFLNMLFSFAMCTMVE